MLLEKGKKKKHWCLAAQMNRAGFSQLTWLLSYPVVAGAGENYEVMIENPAAIFVILNVSIQSLEKNRKGNLKRNTLAPVPYFD